MKLPNIIKDIEVDKATKLSIIGSMLLVSFSFFYYYVIFLPQKEQARIDQQKQEQLTKELKEQKAKNEVEILLNSCLLDAENKWKNWGQQLSKKADECRIQGGGICRTAEAFVEAFEKNDVQLKQDKDECFKRYQQ